jgi:cystathionine beta-lyase/cystathionine gamma-synthase
MTGTNRPRGPSTTAIHAGERPDPVTGASAPSIVMSSTYVAEGPGSFSANDLTADAPFIYGRWGSPTVRMLEDKIAAMEGTGAAACFATGMAAASALFLTRLSAGDHMIISDVSYAGVAELARDTLPRFGIRVTPVDASDPANVAAAMRPETKLVHVETPANPIMRLTDLAAVARIAHEGGAEVSCDSTFATPMVTKPATLGVDWIIHSLTKYIGGHGDALGGAVAGSREGVAALVREAQIHHGATLSPFNAWLIARGAATLPLRMRAHGAAAMAVAEWLEAQPGVTRVFYPGLPSHPQHALAKAQMKGYSGMLSFQVGGVEAGRTLALRMAAELQVIHYAVSLGHHRSLITWIETDQILESSFRLEGAARESYRAFGGDGIFRLSVGLEDAEDLIADLAAVLG